MPEQAIDELRARIDAQLSQGPELTLNDDLVGIGSISRLLEKSLGQNTLTIANAVVATADTSLTVEGASPILGTVPLEVKIVFSVVDGGLDVELAVTGADPAPFRLSELEGKLFAGIMLLPERLSGFEFTAFKMTFGPQEGIASFDATSEKRGFAQQTCDSADFLGR